jgi:predicted RNase H-like HicB family nuclease
MKRRGTGRRVTFTAVFERHGKWHVGYIPELPGVHAQEPTLAAARKSLRLAVRELAELNPDQVFGARRKTEKLEVELVPTPR